jgi:hypothetical protein
LDVLLILVLAVHLLCVNVASAAPVVALWAQWRRSPVGDTAAATIGRHLAGVSLWMLAAGIFTGAAALAVVWQAYPSAYIGAARQIPSERYWWGGAELLFSFFMLGIYYGMWDRWRQRRWLHAAFGVVGVTNLVYHFPLLFAAISVLSTRPETWVEGTLKRGQLMALLFDAETLVRFAHFLLASLAVTGVYLIGYSLRAARRGQADIAARATLWGGRLALAATALQLIFGTLLLLRLPQLSQQTLLGGDLPGTLMFAGSLLATLALLHLLAAAALGGATRGQTMAAIALLTLTVAMMVGAKHRAELPIHARIEAGVRE